MHMHYTNKQTNKQINNVGVYDRRRDIDSYLIHRIISITFPIRQSAINLVYCYYQ
jgi:hypothetical protein